MSSDSISKLNKRLDALEKLFLQEIRDIKSEISQEEEPRKKVKEKTERECAPITINIYNFSTKFPTRVYIEKLIKETEEELKE